MIVFAIAGAHSTTTSQNAKITSPSDRTIPGNKFIIPVTIIDRAATIAVALAATAVDSMVKLPPKAERPALIKTKPAPIPKVATPNNANAPANPNKVGISGVRSKPATPITANAPANITRPLPISSQLSLPSVFITGAIIANAVAAMINAAAPDTAPFIRRNAITSSNNAPPMTASPLPISTQLMPPKLDITPDNTFIAALTAKKPTPIDSMFLGIRFMANVIAAKAPAITVRPLPISSHCIWANSFTTGINICNAAPRIVIDTAVDTTCLAFTVNLVNAANINNKPPIAARPLPNSPHFMVEKSSTALANMSIAADNITMPVAVLTVLPPNFANCRNAASSAISTPTEINPLAIPSGSTVERTFSAAANITIATLILVITILAFITPFILPLSLVNKAKEPINSANRIVIAPNDLSRASGFIQAITSIAAAKRAIAPAIVSNVPAFN